MLYFTIQNRLQDGTSKVSEAAGARWRFYRRISSDVVGLSSNRLSIGGSTSGIFRANLDLQDFVAGAVFGEVGGWLDWLRALEMRFHMWRRPLMTLILCGRCSIWWGWRVIFVWQAQYLVRLAGDFSWQAQHFVTFWEIAGTRHVVFYTTKSSPKMGRVRSRKWRVRDDDFIVGYRRMWSDYRRIVFLLAEALQGFSAQILTFKISWQAQCLVRLDGDFTASTHWKWGCICEADHWWLAFCVAGAVFGEVAGCLCLLPALEIKFST